jgi:hypothetical protein
MIMFRKSYTLIILFLATSSVFGQGIKFGIFFDPMVTWWKSDVSDVTVEKARLGFDFGLSADYYFSENYAFATGISLFNTGGTLKYLHNDLILFTNDGKEPIAPGSTVKYKMQYVKIPVALKFKTHRIGRFIYSANLGFDPMIRVSTRVEFTDTDHLLTSATANKETKLFNLGWHIGAGAQYSLGGDVAVYGGLSFMNTFIDITRPAHDNITSNNLGFRIEIMF